MTGLVIWGVFAGVSTSLLIKGICKGAKAVIADI